MITIILVSYSNNKNSNRSSNNNTTTTTTTTTNNNNNSDNRVHEGIGLVGDRRGPEERLDQHPEEDLPAREARSALSTTYI